LAALTRGGSEAWAIGRVEAGSRHAIRLR
jgi:hypothetical protein